MTLIEVLAPFEIEEGEFVDALTQDLRATPDSSASQLTEAHESLLRERGGIVSALTDDQSIRKATLWSASSSLDEQAR